MQLETLQKEMIAAMKAKDKVRKDVLSSLIGAIKNQAIKDGNKDIFDEIMIEDVILKEKKIIQEQIDTCPVERVELIRGFRASMGVIDEFAPIMLDREEVKLIIIKICEEANIPFEVQNRGRIMRQIMGTGLKRKAGGDVISAVVTELIQ